jgi:hypothetical protein
MQSLAQGSDLSKAADCVSDKTGSRARPRSCPPACRPPRPSPRRPCASHFLLPGSGSGQFAAVPKIVTADSVLRLLAGWRGASAGDGFLGGTRSATPRENNSATEWCHDWFAADQFFRVPLRPPVIQPRPGAWSKSPATASFGMDVALCVDRGAIFLCGRRSIP